MKKAIDWLRKNIKKAMTWMWVGSIVIILSNVLQIIAPSYPSLPLATLGLIMNTISVPFTIVQAYRSAREFEQERRTRETTEQFIYDRTSEGRILRNLSQWKDNQKPRS